MTENENSPENLRKFLESDDPSLVMMGLSMAEGSGIPETLNNIILEISMWNKDEVIRKKASEYIASKFPNFKKLLNSWTPLQSVLVKGNTYDFTYLAESPDRRKNKELYIIEKVFQALIKLPNEYLDSKIKFLLQVPGKRNDMIKHLSNIDDGKVIDSFILIAKTSFGPNIAKFNGNIKSISSGYPSWSSWTCNDSKMTITAADLDRGDELPDAWYPHTESLENFLEIIDILGEMKKKEIIPILNEILPQLENSASNLEYVGKNITQLDKKYGPGNYSHELYEIGESYLDIPGDVKLPDGSFLPSSWPPDGAACEKMISFIESIINKEGNNAEILSEYEALEKLHEKLGENTPKEVLKRMDELE